MLNLIAESRRVLAGLASFGVALLAPVSAQDIAEDDEPLPSVFELSQNHLEANGGLMNIRSIQSVKVSGVSQGAEGEPIRFKAFRKRPDMMRMVTMYPNFEVEAVVDGVRVRKKVVGESGKEEILDLDEAGERQLIMDSKMDGPFFQLIETPGMLTVEGLNEVNGAEAVRLLVSEEADIPYRRIWLSRDHFQEVKLEYRGASRGAWLEGGDEIYFDEFEKTDGVWFARRIRYFSGDELLRELKVEKIRTNVGIFDSYFRLD